MSSTKMYALMVGSLVIGFPLPPAAGAGQTSHDRVFIAWNGSESGLVAAINADPPWNFETPTVEVGQFSILRTAGGHLYALSQMEGTLTVIDAASFELLQVYDLGALSNPQDIAVIDSTRAYVTRLNEPHLLRLDPQSGEMTDILDLSLFADEDGIPDMSMMAAYGELLFIQIQRRNLNVPSTYVLPAMLAVVNLNTETLVDVDDDMPGIQAIELQGTAPKFKMQVIPETGQLFVSATGTSWDPGGIEVINLTALQTEGLVLAETSNQTGVDLGPFVMTTPEAGFLSFTTDFALSSHLKPFTLSGGVEPGPELHVALGYFAPTLVHNPSGGTLFFPDGTFPNPGVYVFDVRTGEQLNEEVIATSGQPSDLLFVPFVACPADIDADGMVATTDLLLLLSAWGANPEHPADIDNSGTVDIADLLLLLASWGPCQS